MRELGDIEQAAVGDGFRSFVLFVVTHHKTNLLMPSFSQRTLKLINNPIFTDVGDRGQGLGGGRGQL